MGLYIFKFIVFLKVNIWKQADFIFCNTVSIFSLQVKC